MSKTYEKPSTGVPVIVKIAIGAVLMFGGMFLATKTTGEGASAVMTGPFHSIEEPLHKMGIPLDLGRTIATIGVFLILFPIIELFFLKPLAQAIQERNSDLERTFGEAEQLRADMTKLKTDYETRLVATEADARERIQASIREAQDLGQTLKAEATARHDRMVAEAEAEIEAEKQRAIAQIRTEVVDLALGAASKVVRANLDDETNRRLVREFVNDTERVTA